MRAFRQRWWEFGVPLAGYTVLALGLTWPLVRLWTTHAPGDGSDDPAIIWNLWWVRFALFNGLDPLYSTYMFWPLGVDLVFYTLTVLNALLTLPFQLTLGLIPANSLLVWFELVVGGLGMFYLARHLTKGVAGPFLAGAVFTFAHSRFVYLSLGQFNIAASHWVPWYILALWRVEERGRRRDVLLAALFLLANGWTEFTYASFLVLFTLLTWAWHRARDLRAGQWPHAIRQTVKYASVGGLFAAGLAPVLLRMISAIRVEGDFLVEGLGFADVFSNDLLGFWVPSHLHPLWGMWVQRTFDFAYLNFAYLGYVPLALALIALFARRTRQQAAFWGVGLLFFVLLSLGPTLRVNGRQWEAPLPFDLLLRLPIFKANRYPSRYSVMIALCLAVLSAYGLETLRRRAGAHRLHRWGLLLGALGLFLVETAAVPLPLSSYRVPAVYPQLKGRETTAVLEIPMAWRNGFRVTGPLDKTFMFAQFYQTVHQKRLLNGNTSRNPEFLFQYFTEAPLLNSILALETGRPLPPGREAFDARHAANVLRFLGVRQVIVHRVNSERADVTPEATVPYLERVLPMTRWYADGRITAWEVTLPPLPRALRFDAGHPLARLYFGEGWSALPPLDSSLAPPSTVWAQRRTVRLFVPLEAERARLAFKACSPVAQRLEVRVNGAPPAALQLEPGWHEYSLLLEGFQPGLNTVRLSFEERVPVESSALRAKCFRAADVSLGPLSSLPVSVVVESAGLDVGDFAHVYVNGRDVLPDRMGYNVVAFDPATGEVTAVAAFDPVNTPEDSRALAAFIGALPPGTPVAVAANDTVDLPPEFGGPRLGAEAVEALRALGATGDLRGTFRWSHALLGVKGAPPGTALEDLSAVRPARVWLGEPFTSPAVAAGFAWFQVEVR